MAHEELIAWSSLNGRPNFQKDALRLIATTGELTDDNLAALRQIIEKDVGLTLDVIPAAIPLVAEDLSEVTTDAPRTILGSIGPVRHVDRLASDQPSIQFAKHGVTLVYGANASGKSGYCRIAKQLCRSSSPKKLKTNVYEETLFERPEVDLAFGVEGDKLERKKVTWRQDDSPPQELARISVFDTETARVYVNKERKVKFLPYELDILNKLALAAKAIDHDFEMREKAVETTIGTPLPVGYNKDTTVSQTLAKLSAGTNQTDLPSEAAIRALAEWNEEKEDDLLRISNEIHNDPSVQLGRYRSSKQELKSIKDKLAKYLALLGDKGFKQLSEAHKEMVVKTKASEAVAQGLGADMPIPEIGTAAWSQMLGYAREFACEVFADRDDPKLVTGETCVLCQQHLDHDAAARMAEFDRYISGRAASDSEEAKKVYGGMVESINTLNITTAQQVHELLAAYASMSEMRAGFLVQIAEVFTVLATRLEAIKVMIKGKAFDDTNGVVTLQDNLMDRIDLDIVCLQTQIDVLEDAEAGEKQIDALKIEKAKLDDAKRLSQQIEIVVERQKQLVERLKIKDARKQCDSTPISRQITARRRNLLTKSLKKQLAIEIKILGLSHIPLDLTDKSKDGESVVEIKLTAAQRVRNNSDVLSEGEQNALALSCFLAELNEVGAKHGIIVDDPVSSLDHTRMEVVAKRLVAEAKAGRQVIIFTHNIVFHDMVKNETRRANLACHTEWMLSKGGTEFGIIDDSGKPPHVKKTKARIKEISESKSLFFKNCIDPDSSEYRDSITAIYTRMRETWERIVEEILFNGTIQRFRPEVMTQSLKHAYFDPTDDYPEIFEGMKKCSRFSGHDQAAELPSALPSKKDIEADIQALVSFHKKVLDRKNDLEKGDSYEKGPTPEFL